MPEARGPKPAYPYRPTPRKYRYEVLAEIMKDNPQAKLSRIASLYTERTGQEISPGAVRAISTRCKDLFGTTPTTEGKTDG